MTHVTPDEVQQWIQDSRLSIDAVDPVLDNTAHARVVAALALRYDTTTWVNVGTTPTLVRAIESMLQAATIINRAHAETMDEVDAYGVHLESSAIDLLGGLADGSIILDDTPNSGDYASGQPSVWPTDTATQIAVDEGWEADGAAPLMFTVGKVF